MSKLSKNLWAFIIGVGLYFAGAGVLLFLPKLVYAVPPSANALNFGGITNEGTTASLPDNVTVPNGTAIGTAGSPFSIYCGNLLNTWTADAAAGCYKNASTVTNPGYSVASGYHGVVTEYCMYNPSANNHWELVYATQAIGWNNGAMVGPAYQGGVGPTGGYVLSGPVGPTGDRCYHHSWCVPQSAFPGFILHEAGSAAVIMQIEEQIGATCP